MPPTAEPQIIETDIMTTLDLIREALHAECGVDPSRVHETSHLLNDLELDSLDLLNASFRIEKATGAKLPVDVWITEEYGDHPPAVSYFTVSSLCSYIEMQELGNRSSHRS